MLVVPHPEERLIVQIVLTESQGLLLDDLSAFLYDTVLLNDATVLSGPDYDYYFDQFFWRRNGRPIRREDRVVVARVLHESPILVELLAGGGSIGLYTGLEYVYYTKSRRRKDRTEQAIRDKELEIRADELEIKRSQKELKRIEAEKARRELEAIEEGEQPTLIVIEHDQPPIRVPRQAGVLQDRDSQEEYTRVVRRLRRSP
jgi:hypothetical protein